MVYRYNQDIPDIKNLDYDLERYNYRKKLFCKCHIDYIIDLKTFSSIRCIQLKTFNNVNITIKNSKILKSIEIYVRNECNIYLENLPKLKKLLIVNYHHNKTNIYIENIDIPDHYGDKNLTYINDLKISESNYNISSASYNIFG